MPMARGRANVRIVYGLERRTSAIRAPLRRGTPLADPPSVVHRSSPVSTTDGRPGGGRYGRHMPTILPSDVPLRAMLEQRRLTHRDRRLEHVIGVLRSRADLREPPPGLLLQAISEFSREHATVRRRLRKLQSEDAASADQRATVAG